MDVNSDKSLEGVVKQKPFTVDDTLKPQLIKFEMQNVVLPKIKTGPTSKYKSEANSIASNGCSPLFDWRSAKPKKLISKRSQSTEKKRPDIPSPKPSPLSPSARRSAPSSPLSRPTIPSTTNSEPSTPTSTSSSCTTPSQDSIVEKQNSSRQLFSGSGADGMWPSVRCLSSDFNSEYQIHHRKKDMMVRSTSDHLLKNSSTVISERKRSPLRGRNASDQSENSILNQSAHPVIINQHRWPAMRGGKVSTMAISKSVNFTDRIGRSASLMLQSRGLSPTRRIPFGDDISKGAHKSSIATTAKANHDIDSNASMTSCQVDNDKTLLATIPSRASSLHMISLCRSTLPKSTKVVSSSSAKLSPIPPVSRPSSPSRTSNGTKNQIDSLSLVLNNIIDVRNGTKGVDMEDVHQLQLLYNMELQWCFVNSRTEAVLSTQKRKAENILTNVWNATSELQEAVDMIRVNVKNLRQEIKLEILLKKQVSYLEDWIALEEEYSTSLSCTIEALIASTLRLPVSRGTKADVRAVKNAISSAIDIMQAMGSSVCYLFSGLEGSKRLLSQLSAVVAKEKALLDQCRELFAATTTMQVQECSLRAEILQNLRHYMHMMG